MSGALALVATIGGSGATGDTSEFTVGSVGGALVLAVVAALPLCLSLWALLDAARRPRWAWALTGRRQVVWMAMILFGALFLLAGVAVSGWYLTRIRPLVAAAEDGDF